MNIEIEKIIKLQTIRDIEIALLKAQQEGYIIPELVYEIITKVEKSYELPPEVINEQKDNEQN
jgi:hypothetical protein